MDLKKDDPLLSGVIDLRCVPVQLESHLIGKELWNSMNKEIYLKEEELKMYCAIRYSLDNGVILSTVHERETSYEPNRLNNVTHIEENQICLFNEEVNLFFLQSHGTVTTSHFQLWVMNSTHFTKSEA
ncbi:9067_t:CDS:2 [Diversispora eburnea]|uniref:9067_t:CDS:1 n=1 Tax=Diversispora eburnea TaxID=1213867 RepID=A0A9N8W1L8_9GLOM|nr:9067_t:CDS:2 [Diversispora eburnea]